MFRRVLIANRGEIAARIARTCQALGIEYVAVHSEADSRSPHLRGAVDSVGIGPGAATQSYLDIDRVVQAGLDTGCDAVHPGYGFLSENPAFARAVADAGMVFIGPSPEIIEAMGDKSRAKALMREADVPVVPGSDEGTEDPERLATLARETGFPVLLKPVAGGGGKGMTVLHEPRDVLDAVRAAVRLSRSSFGDGRLLVERFVARPRHVEVQVFGDMHGNVVHLFERECSLQRRHQKVVEEAPVTFLPEATREALRKAAVDGARALAYRNAGTFEFIVASSGEFYFLEVNTRLQVEHPVTEMVTGLDLVEWQLRIAAGETLPLSQEQIVCSGHAVECRIYAEDPSDQFKPSPGRILALAWPAAARVDAGVDNGGEVSSFYDPMVAKIITAGADRQMALRNMRRALDEITLLGLTTNTGFLRLLLAQPAVLRGELDTNYIDAHLEEFQDTALEGRALACAAAMRLPLPVSEPVSPWFGGGVGALDRRYLEPQAPFGRLAFLTRGTLQDVCVHSVDGPACEAEAVGARHTVEAHLGADGVWRGRVGEETWAGLEQDGLLELQVGGNRVQLLTERAAEAEAEAGANLAVSPMPGVVTAVQVEPGQTVARGDVLVVIEAMKMETSITAPMDGTVSEVRCSVGESVAANALLVLIDEPAPARD